MSDVVDGLQRDFLTGNYSDLRIIDRNDTVYNVHKVVLCHQSPWFEEAVRETGDGNTFHLRKDEPAAVKAMVEFFYTGTYSSNVDTISSAVARLYLDISIYAIGAKYMVKNKALDLAQVAVRHIQRDLWLPDQQNVLASLPQLVQSAYAEAAGTEESLLEPFLAYAVDNSPRLLRSPGFRGALDALPAFRQSFCERIARRLDFYREVGELLEERGTYAWACKSCNKAFVGMARVNAARTKCDRCGFDGSG
ncbi:BTB/POZ-like protein [Macrophomina phaseolina MS6]|uniref:BTB/POZ-like protein n=1 Tax=Macrophomina phaseolina (strain MS6) TaxID=1126212 RepID=K2QZ28_MACPH|nr:BTB/POZ-like protein [Macrophomina phaseolina MS6]